ncbi:MAG: hypothetical protein IKI28_03925, partial [Bacteroidales bacterium]|nr:hypothetical protein [Bacteroidales bacterium]
MNVINRIVGWALMILWLIVLVYKVVKGANFGSALSSDSLIMFAGMLNLCYSKDMFSSRKAPIWGTLARLCILLAGVCALVIMLAAFGIKISLPIAPEFWTVCFS